MSGEDVNMAIDEPVFFQGHDFVSDASDSASEHGSLMDVDIEDEEPDVNPHLLNEANAAEIDDEWRGFDEFQDVDIPISREEMICQLDEMIMPDKEERLWDIRNDVLSEEDRDNIRAFKLKLMANMPRTAFDQMRYSFNHKLDISSDWVITHRLAILTRVEPELC
ncbi:hypothetical protein B0H11DRAFT_2219815 [Mycena galericulata]|nr:hypothetical protein B0H11DRAFT_2219815 [Mycena galericulata]